MKYKNVIIFFVFILVSCDMQIDDLRNPGWGFRRIIVREEIILKDSLYVLDYPITIKKDYPWGIGARLFFPDLDFKDNDKLKLEVINSLKGLIFEIYDMSSNTLIKQYSINPGKKGFGFWINDTNIPQYLGLGGIRSVLKGVNTFSGYIYRETLNIIIKHIL